MNISTASSPSQIVPCENYLPSVVALAEKGEWEPFGFDVDYCLSENVPETCSYSGSVPILIVVIVCNALKVIVMLVAAFRLRGNSLITIGDAIESFLNQPDESTRGSCLLSKSDVRKMKFASWKRKTASYRLRTLTANLQSFCWWRAASIRRWSFTLLFTGFNLGFTGGLLAMALIAIYKVGLSIVSLGIGRLNGGAIIQGGFVGSGSSPSSQIIGSIIIANLPQAILSFIYLHLNGLLTTMFLASEYFGYVRDRKGLRVSTPKPDTSQRSTYFLQLPYRVAIPLMILSGVLHWLVSQSIFLAVVAAYASTGELTSSVAIASCGYSPLAMILVLALGGSIVMGTVLLGSLRRYNSSGMPLAGSCSLAISAACHPPSWDLDAALKPVKWGVVSDSVGEKNAVGHCSFTSGDVGAVEGGAKYA